jgi:WD40 repeat protein/serine/threonine protein kinase
MHAEANDLPETGAGLSAVLVACLEARDHGQPLDRQALLARYPHFAAELNKFLDDQEGLECQVAPLRAAAQRPEAALPPATAAPTELGDFRIVRELGRGGMGVVYEAEQVSLRRKVALKVLPLAATLDPRRLQRFQNEARAAACLHHTNIVPVFAVGEHQGVHYYAMQLIAGQTLAAVLNELRGRAQGQRTGQAAAAAPPDAPTTAHSPPPDETAGESTAPQAALSTAGGVAGREYLQGVARLGLQAAEALDYAHQMGVVHRDVKPGNLMVDARGQVWITDFGLALLQQGEPGLTLTGDLVGTLRYMSPEQALAKRVVIDHRTDVYSLGATLYELLTLQPVFAGTDRQELLRQIAFEEPTPPRRLNKAVPAELEKIVLKALEKNPAERYAAAQELADDLQRWQRDEPIRAKRAGLVRRVRKWGRRHSAFVIAALAALTLVMLASLVSAVLIARAYKAEAKQRLAVEQERDTAQRHLHTAQVHEARRAWENGDLIVAEELLDGLAPQPGQPDLRSWECQYLRALCHRDLLTIEVKHNQSDPFRLNSALSPDGRQLCTTDQKGAVDIWDAATGEQIVHLDPHAGPSGKVAWSLNGRRLSAMFANGTFEVWDTRTWQTVPSIDPRPETAVDFAWSPNGQRLAIWTRQNDSRDFLLQIWEFGKDPPVITILDKGPWCHGLRWNSNGRWLASNTGRGCAVWDAATGEELLRWSSVANVKCWSADGQKVVVTHGTQLWPAGGKNKPPPGTPGWPGTSSRGWERRLRVNAIGGMELAVQIWDVAKRQAVTLKTPVTAGVSEAAWQPNGQLLALGRADGTLTFWDVGRHHLFSVAAHKDQINSVAWDPDGKLVATSGCDHVVKVWNPATMEEVRAFRGHRGPVDRVDWSPDGQRLFSTAASSSVDQSVKIWDAATGQDALPLPNPEFWVERLAWASDQQLLGAGQVSGKNGGLPQCRVAAWDVTTGHETPAPQGGKSKLLVDQFVPFTNRAYSPDGRLMAQANPPAHMAAQSVVFTVVESKDDRFRNPLCRLTATGSWTSMAFSPDGSRLAASCWLDGQRSVAIWDTTSGNEVVAIKIPGKGSLGDVACLAWSADGRRLASGTSPETGVGLITLWDAATGQAVLTLGEHKRSGAGVNALAWSPNGQQLASLVNWEPPEQRIELWDVSRRVVWRPSALRAGKPTLPKSP